MGNSNELKTSEFHCGMPRRGGGGGCVYRYKSCSWLVIPKYKCPIKMSISHSHAPSNARGYLSFFLHQTHIPHPTPPSLYSSRKGKTFNLLLSGALFLLPTLIALCFLKEPCCSRPWVQVKLWWKQLSVAVMASSSSSSSVSPGSLLIATDICLCKHHVSPAELFYPHCSSKINKRGTDDMNGMKTSHC